MKWHRILAATIVTSIIAVHTPVRAESTAFNGLMRFAISAAVGTGSGIASARVEKHILGYGNEENQTAISSLLLFPQRLVLWGMEFVVKHSMTQWILNKCNLMSGNQDASIDAFVVATAASWIAYLYTLKKQREAALLEELGGKYSESERPRPA